MSVVRSPPQSLITCTDGNGNSIATAGKAGGSQPDLRNISKGSSEVELRHPQITLRQKRKLPEDDFTAKFESFQSKIQSILLDMSKTQAENLNKISQDVSSIKEQISQIKVTTDTLVADQEKLKTAVANMYGFKTEIEQKVDALKKEIESLKPASINQCLLQQGVSYEDIISEMNERSHREKKYDHTRHQ